MTATRLSLPPDACRASRCRLVINGGEFRAEGSGPPGPRGEKRARQNAALAVEENDPQALAKAMIEIMQDAELRHRLAQCGRALAPATGMGLPPWSLR